MSEPKADSGAAVPCISLLALADSWGRDAALLEGEASVALHRLEKAAYKAAAQRVRGMANQVRNLCANAKVRVSE